MSGRSQPLLDPTQYDNFYVYPYRDTVSRSPIDGPTYLLVDRDSNSSDVGFSGYRWNAAGSSEADLFDLRAVSAGAINGQGGADILLLGASAAGGGTVRIDVDVEKAFIFAAFAEPDEPLSIVPNFLFGDDRLQIGNYSMMFRGDAQRMIDRDAIIFDPSLFGQAARDNLIDIGASLADPMDLRVRGPFKEIGFDEQDNIVRLNAPDYQQYNAGFGADVIWADGKAGGYVNFGGIPGERPSSVDVGGVRISLPGSDFQPDDSADTFILSAKARGEWAVGGFGAGDRLVLANFPEIDGLSDLQAIAEDAGGRPAYRFGEDLTLRFVDADQIVLGVDLDFTLLGGQGSDRMLGAEGDDVLKGKGGRDRLRGEEGNDRLVGGGSADKLFGGSGKDILIGGRGDDLMVGGRGTDRFVLRPGSGDDKVRDWRDGIDIIEIQGAVEGFEDLDIEQDGRNAVIRYEDGSLTLLGRSAGLLDALDFDF